MLVLGLLGMFFDAAMVFVTKSSLFLRLAVAVLWRLGGSQVEVEPGSRGCGRAALLLFRPKCVKREM